MLKDSHKLKLFLLQTLFGLVLIAIWLRFIDLKVLLVYFQQVNPTLIILGITFSLVSLGFRIVRWRLILQPVAEVNYVDVFLYTYIQSLLNTIVPVRAGEFGVSYLIKKKYSVSYVKTLATTFLNRIFDLVGIFTIAVFSLLVILPQEPKFWPLFLSSLLLLLILATFLYLISYQENVLEPVFRFLKNNLPGQETKFKAVESFKSFLLGLGVSNLNFNQAVFVSLITFAAFIFDGLYLFFVFKAFGISVYYPMVLFAMAVFTVSFLLPAAPLNIGTTEVAGSLVFTFVLGIDKNAAASVTVFWHLLNTVSLVILGSLAFWIYQMRNQEPLKTKEENTRLLRSVKSPPSVFK